MSPQSSFFKRIYLIRKPIPMFSSFRHITKRQFRLAGVMAAMIFAAAPAWSQTTATAVSGRALEAVLAEKLTVAPGKVLTAQIVHYAPGGSSQSHHHDADVFAFVLSGKILSGEEGEEAKVYNVGEGHFERRGQHHVISKNASTTEPASMLVVFIANEKAALTTFDH
jgi:quercetin dioxygenase-like cupin family protein